MIFFHRISKPISIILLFSLVSPCLAQPGGLSGTSGKAAAFNYYIWGQVRGPGIHKLGPKVDITELLSAAGGPMADANLSNVEIMHGIDHRIEQVDLNEVYERGETITLSPGDVVIIKRNFWPKFRETISIVSSFAVFINLAYTMARYYTD